MSERYKIGDSTIPHFITITVIDWVDLFTRPVYKDYFFRFAEILQREKGIEHPWLLHYDKPCTPHSKFRKRKA